ncbi:MAG: hypothetical protein PHG87_07265, partial [Candidatus Omnitrophica bacterium]|nr:hypothetical protein [Candidatus Omnitrophota bacterium]
MNINQQPTEDSIEQPKKEFKSSFKTWIRAVAFIVIAVFLPEQAAQAMGYDPTTIWNHSYFVNQGKNGFLTYLVADNIKRSLDSLSYKQLNQVQLDKNLVVETAPLKESETSTKASEPSKVDQSNFYDKIGNALQSGSAEIIRFASNGLKKTSLPDQSSPTTRQGTASSQKPSLYLTGSVVKQISLWLKDPKTQVDNNCGINALNALFVQSGIKLSREELATRAIMVDFLSGNLREFKGELALSLFALQKTAVSFGLKTALVKIPAASLQGGQAISSLVPFITYLLSEHFVLVTRVTNDKIYYKEDKEEANMPKEIFLKGFTGNCLLLDSKLLQGSKAISLLSDKEALEISGKESFFDRYNSLKSSISNTAKSSISSISSISSTAQSYVSKASSTYTAASNVYNTVKSVTGISISSIVTRSSIPSNPLSAISVPVTTYNYLASPSTKGNLGKSYGAANTLQTDFALTVPKRAYDFTGWVDTVSGLNSNLGTKLYQSSSLVRSISDAYSGAKGRTESSLKQTYGIGTYNNFIKPTEYFVADTAITTAATLGIGSAVGLAGGTLSRVGSVSRIAEPIISRLPQLSRITEIAGPKVGQGLEWVGTKGWSAGKWMMNPATGRWAIAKTAIKYSGLSFVPATPQYWATSAAFTTYNYLNNSSTVGNVRKSFTADAKVREGVVISVAENVAGMPNGILEIGTWATGGLTGFDQKKYLNLRAQYYDNTDLVKSLNKSYGDWKQKEIADPLIAIYGQNKYNTAVKPQIEVGGFVGSLFVPIAGEEKILTKAGSIIKAGKIADAVIDVSKGVRGIRGIDVAVDLNKGIKATRTVSYADDTLRLTQKSYTPIRNWGQSQRLVTSIHSSSLTSRILPHSTQITLANSRALNLITRYEPINLMKQKVSRPIYNYLERKTLKPISDSLKPSYKYVAKNNPVSLTKLGEYKSTAGKLIGDRIPLRMKNVFAEESASVSLGSLDKSARLLYQGGKGLYQGGKWFGKNLITEFVPRLLFYGSVFGTLDAAFIYKDNQFNQATGELSGNNPLLFWLRATELNMGFQILGAKKALWDKDLFAAEKYKGLADKMSKISMGGQLGNGVYLFVNPQDIQDPNLRKAVEMIPSPVRRAIAIPVQMVATSEGFASFPAMTTYSTAYYTQAGYNKEGYWGWNGALSGFFRGAVVIPSVAMFSFTTSVLAAGINTFTFGDRYKNAQISNWVINSLGKPVASFIARRDVDFKTYAQPEYIDIAHRDAAASQDKYEGADYFFGNLFMMGGFRQAVGLKRPEAKDVSGRRHFDTPLIDAGQRVSGALLTPMHLTTAPIYGGYSHYAGKVAETRIGKFLGLDVTQSRGLKNSIAAQYKEVGQGILGISSFTLGNLNKIAKSEVNLARISLPLEIARKINERREELNGVTLKIGEVEEQIRLNERNFLRKPDSENSQKKRELSTKRAELTAYKMKLSNLVEVEGIKQKIVSLEIAGRFGTKDYNQAVEKFVKADLGGGVEGILNRQFRTDLLNKYKRVKTEGDGNGLSRAWNKISTNSEYNRAVKTLDAIKDIDIGKIDEVIKDTQNQIQKSIEALDKTSRLAYLKENGLGSIAGLNDNSRRELARKFYEDGVTAETIKEKGFWENWQEFGQGLSGISQERMNDGMRELFKLRVLKFDQEKMEKGIDSGFRVDFEAGKELKAGTAERKIFDTLEKMNAKGYNFQNSVGDLIKNWDWKKISEDSVRFAESKDELANILSTHSSILKNPDAMNNPEFRGLDKLLKDSRGKTELGIFLALTTFKHSGGRESLGLFASPNELKRVYEKVLEKNLGGEKISFGEGVDGIKVKLGGVDYTFVKITEESIKSSYLSNNLDKLNEIFKDKIILTDISTLQNLNMQKIVPSQGEAEKQLAKRLAEIIYDRAVIIDEIHQVSQSPYHIVGFDGKTLAEFLKPAEYEKYVDVAEKIDRKFQELANLEEVTNNKGEPVTTVKGYGNLGDRLIKMEYVDEYKGLTTAGENEFKRLLGDKFVTQAENKDFSIERLLVNSFVRNLFEKEEQEGGFGLKKNERQEDEVHPVHFGKINEKMQWSTPEEAISRWVLGFRMKDIKTKDKDNNIIDIPVREIISKIKISEESVKVSPISVLANFKSSKTFFSATPFYAETMSDLLGVKYQGDAAKFMAKVKSDLEGRIEKGKVGVGDYGEMIRDGKFKLADDRPNIILPALLTHIPDFLNKVSKAAGGRDVFYIEVDDTVSKIVDGQRVEKLELLKEPSGEIIKPKDQLEKRVNEGKNIVVVFSPSKLTSFSFDVKKAEGTQKEAQYTLIMDKDTSATDYWQALRRNRENLEDFNVIFNGPAGEEPLKDIWKDTIWKDSLVKTENLKKNDALVKAITETHQDAMAGRFVRFTEVFPERADLAYQLLKAFQSKHAKDTDITPDKIRSNAYRQIISGFNSDITFFNDVIKDFSPLLLSKEITEGSGETKHTLKFKLTSAEKRFFEDYLKQDKIFRDRNGLDSSRSTGVDKAKVKSELEAIARFKGIPNLEAARFRDYLAQRYSTKELLRKKVSSPESKEAIVVAQQKIQDALETKNGTTPKELAADIRQDLIGRGYTESAVAGVLSQMYPSLKESNWLARRGINANYIGQGVLGFGQAFLFINNQENKEKDWFTKLIEKLNFSLGYGKAIGTIQSFSGEFEPEFKEFLSKYYETDGAKGNMRTALRSSLDKMIAASVRGVWESRKNLEFYQYMKDMAGKNIPAEDKLEELKKINGYLDMMSVLGADGKESIEKAFKEKLKNEKALKDEISRLDKLLNHQIARTNELNVLKARLGRLNDVDELQVALWAQKFVSPAEKRSGIMNKIMTALGMKEKLNVADLAEDIREEVNENIDAVVKEGKIPELVVVFGKANSREIKDTVAIQNKYYEKNKIAKVQIPVFLDESVKSSLISSLGIFYNQDNPSLGVSSRYYSTEFLMEYLVKPLQKQIFEDRGIKGFVMPVGKIPLSAREHGIVTNILGEGSAQAKGAFISTHPYTTGWMGGVISTIGLIPLFGRLWDFFGTGFKTALQRVMNHELGHVHRLGHDAKAAYSVMSSSEKEDGSFWSWKWHFWRKDNTYQPEHLETIKKDIAQLTGGKGSATSSDVFVLQQVTADLLKGKESLAKISSRSELYRIGGNLKAVAYYLESLSSAEKKEIFARIDAFADILRGHPKEDIMGYKKNGFDASAHSMDKIVGFFNLLSNTELNPSEKSFKETLLSQNLLVGTESNYQANGEWYIIGLVRGSSLITHELRHIVYRAIEAYRNAVNTMWNNIPVDKQKIIAELLTKIGGYDFKGEEGQALLVREYAAYLADWPAFQEYLNKKEHASEDRLFFEQQSRNLLSIEENNAQAIRQFFKENSDELGTSAEDKRDGGMVRGGQANVFINGENVNKQIFDKEAVNSYQLAIERLGEASLGINAFNKYGNGTASVNQNFATPLYDHLAKLVSENKIAEAKQAINNLVGFIYRQWGAGIIDTDHKYLLDYGVDGNGEIIWLDPGKASSRKTDFVIDSYRESGDIKGSLLGLSQELYNYYIGLTANFADEFQKHWPEGSLTDADYMFDGGTVETVAKLIAEYRVVLPVNEAIAKVRGLGYSEELITKAIGYNIGLGSGFSNNPLDRGGNKQDKTGQRPASPALPLAPGGQNVPGVNVVSHSGVAGSSNQALVGSRPVLPNNSGIETIIPSIRLQAIGVLTSFTSGLAPPAALAKTFISNVSSSVANAVRSAVELAEKLSGAQSANSGNGEKGQDARSASGNNIGKRSEVTSTGTNGEAKYAETRGSIRAYSFPASFINDLKKLISILQFKNPLIPVLNQFINKLSGVSSWLSSKTVLAYRSTLDLNNAEAIPSLRDGGDEGALEIYEVIKKIGNLVEKMVEDLKSKRRPGETIAGRYPGEKNRRIRDAITRNAEDSIKSMRRLGMTKPLSIDEVGLNNDDDFTAKMTIFGAITGVEGSREKLGNKLAVELDKIIDIKNLSDKDKIELIVEMLKGIPLLESAKIIKPLESALQEGYLMSLPLEDSEKLQRILGEHRDYNGNEQILKMLEEIKKGQEEFGARLDKTEEKLEDVEQEAGAAKQEAGAAKQEAGAAKQEAGAAKQEAGAAKQEAGAA